MWYHPRGIPNNLGLFNFSDNDKSWVQYDSQESKDFIFTCIKDVKETHFCRAPRGLHYIDTKAIKNGENIEVLINTAE